MALPAAPECGQITSPGLASSLPSQFLSNCCGEGFATTALSIHVVLEGETIIKAPVLRVRESECVVPAETLKSPVLHPTQKGANRGTGCLFLPLPLLPRDPRLPPPSM
eukprot:superscaffoldBa00008626_g23501